jgi:outer membrane protein assembly factor BamB
MVILFWRKLLILLTAFSLLAVLPTTPRAPTALIDWLQFNFDPQHSGNNPQETAISAANAASLAVMFQVTLPATADGAPAYLSSVTTPTGLKNLVFVTTVTGTIDALDASTGVQVWSHQNPAGTCRINNGSSVCYTTSSPVVDPNRQYVYSYGLDGFVHKYQVGNGTEITTGGWPELATLKPFNEKGSSALSFATAQNGTTYLYVTNGGYPGDAGDYQGHVTAINLADGSQKVFNTMCSNQAVHFHQTPGTPDCTGVQSAIWARPGVIYNPENNRIYMATGNGTFDPAAYEWGDTIFALNPDGTGANGNPLDSYTPTNYSTLQATDADLGSTAPAIVPVPANSSVAHLAVQAGKDAMLRLVNLDNLSGLGGTGHTGGQVGAPINVPQGGQVLTMPAVWVNPADSQAWVFVSNQNGISGLKLVVNGSGTPSLSPVWQNSGGGSSPVLAGGVLFFSRNNLIQALNPLTGAALWSSTATSGIHWESPIVVNGVVYITDESSKLTAFSLNGSIPNYPFRLFIPHVNN